MVESLDEFGFPGLDHQRGAVSANKLLDRVPEESYIEEWTDLLMRPKEREKIVAEESAVIFRLSNEWLALSTFVLVEVTNRRPFHSIPHVTYPAFLGTVNFRGQLWMGVNMHVFLNIELTHEPIESKAFPASRMLAIEQANKRWVFPVDEVFGVHHFDRRILENVPVTVMRSNVNYLQGVFKWQNKNVAYIDSDLLFHSLERSIL
ncbi:MULTISPECIES: chemotaxis protein CheW [Parachlamydia]|jgi:chemotaxis-related protein WspD|uniref:Chemotaxis protein CheW n=2 Tax=Parachlamydia acanthamoebae TaxID=83552 RepID=F8KZ42_PARAV|nr:chemotaxis protein CheW [Parachlamydia acanthamoebae]EFB41958.1 hypothetical protein pah_c022o295 [Parachlamydia acanthamoebae str. Hall's coccus]KIA78096.1 Chemotaxis signal transduction protein CheW [Parachlamydia acanthamoebae]CCB86165.1 chemotaxis signal transduction protein CheW [Parachlamydia acanthamoebae UV-7]